MKSPILLNERDLHEARSQIARLNHAVSSQQTLQHVAAGFSPEIIELIGKVIVQERHGLLSAISAYECARDNGDATKLEAKSQNDPGIALIVARIAKGFSQKELAWRLGIKEQQLQRYEADRYKSISIKNYSRIAVLLGVQLKASFINDPLFRGLDDVIDNAPRDSIKKVLRHGRQSGWFGPDVDEARLRKDVADNRIEFGSPSLLRTGLNVVDHSDDILLHAWRARVASIARNIVANGVPKFETLDISWMHDLLAASLGEEGPRTSVDLLKQKGIVLVVEPQIPGLAIDGASFTVDDVPVIGLTLRKDSIDNFWFTLLHELGHVILHYRTGLATGFYDQIDAETVDEQEKEADYFAENILIAKERWRRSSARIANSVEPIEKFAAEVGLHSAIVFGRIRKERKNYKIFSNKIGQGTVRRLFICHENLEGRS